MVLPMKAPGPVSERIAGIAIGPLAAKVPPPLPKEAAVAAGGTYAGACCGMVTACGAGCG